MPAPRFSRRCALFTRLALGDFTDDECLLVQPRQPDEDLIRLFFRDGQDHPDAAVEGPEHLGIFDIAPFLQQVEQRGDSPAVPTNDGFAAVRQHPGNVLQKAAAGNVGNAVDPEIAEEVEYALYVDAGWGQKLVRYALV